MVKKISWKGINQKVFSSDKGIYILKALFTKFIDGLPDLELPEKTYKPETTYVKEIGKRTIRMTEECNRDVQKFYKEKMPGHTFNNDKFIVRLKKLFAVLAVFVESDNYYGDIYMNYQIQTCAMHDDVKRQQIDAGKPENYWKQYIKERVERNKIIGNVLVSRQHDVGGTYLEPKEHANVTE